MECIEISRTCPPPAPGRLCTEYLKERFKQVIFCADQPRGRVMRVSETGVSEKFLICIRLSHLRNIR